MRCRRTCAGPDTAPAHAMRQSSAAPPAFASAAREGLGVGCAYCNVLASVRAPAGRRPTNHTPVAEGSKYLLHLYSLLGCQHCFEALKMWMLKFLQAEE